jgi:hypothetical protein
MLLLGVLAHLGESVKLPAREIPASTAASRPRGGTPVVVIVQSYAATALSERMSSTYF